MRPPHHLPPDVSVREIADAAREALDAFLALSAVDAHGLLDWFKGPYRRAVTLAHVPMGGWVPGEHGTTLPVALVVRDAQQTVIEAMRAAAVPGAEGLVSMLPSTVDVVPVQDADGLQGFAPLDRAHAHLATRVLSLLLADYLTRPDEYVVTLARRQTLRELPEISHP